MPFPSTALPVVVQAKIDGINWTDITADVRLSDRISITRGYSNEQSSAEPSTMQLTLNNRGGKYSPRNPFGPYWGLLGRNTELRVAIREDSTWLDIPGPTGSIPSAQHILTPDSAALDITGDIDVRFDADLDTWRESLELVTKGTDSTNQRSYSLTLLADGSLIFYRSSDGINYTSHGSTNLVPIVRGRIAVRATFQVNLGGNRVTTFYYAPTLAGPWTMMSQHTTPGTFSIFSGSAPLAVLDNPGSFPALPVTVKGKVYGVEVRSGVNGTIVAKPDFTAQTPGTTSFVDVAGRTWTLTGTALTNLNVRAHGEVPAWPTKWDTSGHNVYTPLTVAGVTRRLGQGASPLSSAMYRGMTSASDTDVVAYWPVEDNEGSDVISSGLQRGLPFRFDDADNTQLSSYSMFPGTNPIATLGDKSVWNASIRSYPATGKIQVWWLMAVPANGATNNQGILKIKLSGSVSAVDVRYFSTGSLNMSAYAADDSVQATSPTVGYNVNGRLLKCSLNIQQNGSDVDIDLKTLEVGQSLGATSSWTVANRFVSRATGITVSPGGNFSDVAIGQISVQDTIRNLFDSSKELNAWRGETAGRRMQRLCREEGVMFRGFGDLTDTVPAGYQESRSILELLQDCATADGGILSESRDDLSICYVPRSTMQGQQPQVTVPYSSMRGLDPVEDDQSLSNDVTVSRPAGSSARVQLLSGPLSVLSPPLGAGRYETADSRNLAYDSQLDDYANWLMHIRTVDEARYPRIEFNLAHPTIASNADLTALLRHLDLGDRATITGPMPLWISPDTIDQLVLGTVEDISAKEHRIEVNAVPYDPYRVGVYNDLTGQTRYDTGGSTLVSAVNSTATAFSLATTNPTPNILWTTNPASFPLELQIGPERVRVTAITGTSSPQAATVVRGINGVAVAHPAGRAISLADPVYYGM